MKKLTLTGDNLYSDYKIWTKKDWEILKKAVKLLIDGNVLKEEDIEIKNFHVDYTL